MEASSLPSVAGGKSGVGVGKGEGKGKSLGNNLLQGSVLASSFLISSNSLCKWFLSETKVFPLWINIFETVSF